MRATLVLLALAVLAGLFWFLRESPRSADLDVSRPAGTPTTDAGPSATPGRRDGPTDAERAPVASGDAADAPPEARPALRVRVLDAAGAVAPGVFVRADLSAFQRGRADVRPTAADGVATFPLQQAPADGPGAIPVVLVLATLDPIHADVPLATVVRGEVHDLRLPPFGSLAVTMQRADGSPYRGTNVDVELRALAPSETLADAERRTGATTSTATGVAEFAFVPLHTAFAVLTSSAGLRSPFAAQRADGPTAAGQRVEVTLRQDDAAACLIVRLVDAARAPLRQTAVQIELQEALGVGGSRGMTSMATGDTTDASGELRFWVDAAGEDRTLELGFTRRDHPGHRGRVRVDRALVSGENHLGDVVLDEVRTVAVAGTVVDEAGAPIAEAGIDVYRITALPSGGSSFDHADVDARSDANGAFAVRLAGPADARFSLRADKEGYVGEGSVEAAFGASDVRLVLRRAGAIEGSIDAEAALLEYVGVRARRLGESRPVEAGLDDATGEFTLGNLPAGTYSVEVTLRSQGRPCVIVGDVVVRGGDPTLDPRLQHMKLPPGLRRVVVRVEDAAGRALPDAVVRAAEPDDVANHIRLQEHGPAGVTMLAVPGAELIAGARGYRSQRFTLVEDSQSVRLQPGIAVRVNVTGDYAAAHPGLLLAVEAEPVAREAIHYRLDGERSSTAGMVRGMEGLFAAAGEIAPGATSTLVHVPAPGRWIVGLAVLRNQGTMRVVAAIQGDARREVTVGETGGEITLELSAAAVTAALAR